MGKNQLATQQAIQSTNGAEVLQAPVPVNPSERETFLQSITFKEAMEIALVSARWSDVLTAATELAAALGEHVTSDDSASVAARKVGAKAPMTCARFRLSVMSYRNAKLGCNPTQQAELAAKLPELRKVGTLKKDEFTFGGLVIPPAIGPFSES